MATYLLTLVLQGRAPILGHIERGRLRPTEAGRIIREEWLRVPLIRREVFLDVFVVMPDHFHAIVAFDPHWLWKGRSLRPDGLNRPVRSLGTLVWGFKCVTTARIRPLLPDTYPPGTRLWQRNYHERILRTDAAVDRARRYVLANPSQWRPRGARHTV